MSAATLSATDLLTLTQWPSPAFPVGAFSYSHGLEWAAQSGDVSDSDSLRDWLTQVIRHGAGRNDLILLAAAYRATGQNEFFGIDALARALSHSAERLLETVQQGAAFARTVSDIWALELPPLAFPAAVGAAARARAIPLDATARLFLHAFTGNLTSAAIRLVPLGQTRGQSCLAAVVPQLNRTTDEALTKSNDDLGSTTFLIDIASMRHETQYSRMFRS